MKSCLYGPLFRSFVLSMVTTLVSAIASEPLFADEAGPCTIIVEAEDFHSQELDEKRHWHTLAESGSLPGELGEGDAAIWGSWR